VVCGDALPGDRAPGDVSRGASAAMV